MDSRSQPPEADFDDPQVEINDLDVNEFPLSPFAGRLNRFLRDLGRRTKPWHRLALFCALTVFLVCLLLAQVIRPWSIFQRQANGVSVGTLAPAPSPTLIPTSQVTYIQTPDNAVTAYRASDGRVLWRRQLAGNASLSATDQVLYCLVQTRAGATLEALSEKDGHVVWSQNLAPAGAAPALLAENGQVYASTRDGRLEAFRASDGRELWSYRYAHSVTLPLANFLAIEQNIAIVETPDGVSHLLRASDGVEITRYISDGSLPLIDQGIVYIFLGFNSIDETDGTIQALRASDGALLWRMTMRVNQGWAPVEIAGTVYADSSDGALLALRGVNGRLLWSYQARSPVVGAPTGQDGRLYALLQDGSVVALRASNGSLLWKTRIGVFAHLPGYTPLLDGPRLFLSALEAWGNVVYALRISDGRILWSHDMGSDNPLHTPIFFDGIFYLSQNDGSLDAWNASNGAHLWHYAPSSSIDWIVTEEAGRILYIKAFDDSIAALQSSDGKILWRYSLPGAGT